MKTQAKLWNESIWIKIKLLHSKVLNVTAKAVPRGNFTALNVYIMKEEKYLILITQAPTKRIYKKRSKINPYQIEGKTSGRTGIHYIKNKKEGAPWVTQLAKHQY